MPREKPARRSEKLGMHTQRQAGKDMRFYEQQMLSSPVAGIGGADETEPTEL